MKSTTLIIPLLTTLAAAQGFFDECAKPWSLGYRNRVHFVIATCPGPDDKKYTSTINLNDCLSNSEGVLRADKVGFAFHSCSSCTAATPSTNAELTCQCKQTGGQPKTTIIDLNTVVSNTDGIIGCFGLPGFEVAPSEL